MLEQTQDTSAQRDNSVETPILPSALHHIGLQSSQFEAMQEFYQTLLGVSPILEIKGFGSFYTFDLTSHSLVLFHNRFDTQPVPSTLNHIAFSYHSIDDLLRIYQRLKRHGIAPINAINHGSNTSFYYHDPDNNRVELLVDNFTAKTPEELNEIMSHALQNKPINPETYLAAWQQGATQKELYEQSLAGAFAEGAHQLPGGGRQLPRVSSAQE